MSEHIERELDAHREALELYCDPDSFLNEATGGRLFTRDGRRTMLATDDLLAGLHLALDETLGDAAGEVLYLFGCEWGKQNVIGFEQRFARAFGNPPADMLFSMVLQAWWWPLQASGFGTWRYDLEHHDEGLIYVDVWDSMVSAPAGGHAACHFYAGMFAAVFGHFANRELSAIEIQCTGTGESHCRFLVGSSRRINAPHFWRDRKSDGDPAHEL
ncbi:MAG: V4R domain-containing protein [Myxococcota bacterium]